MARAKDLVAWVELGYVPANGFDLAGHIRPESRILWLCSPVRRRMMCGLPLLMCQSAGLREAARTHD
jgi:hypothetical protein